MKQLISSSVTRDPTLRLQRRGWVVAALLLAVVSYLLYATLAPSPVRSGVVMQSVQQIGDHTLLTAGGQRLQLAELRGENVMITFGYVSCPDVCPLSLTKLATMLDALGAKADRVKVLFVSVDTERDSPQRVAEYAAYFHPAIVGVTADEATLRRLATELGVYYALATPDSNGWYAVDHTASFMFIDPQGRVRLIFPPTVSGTELAADLQSFIR